MPKYFSLKKYNEYCDKFEPDSKGMEWPKKCDGKPIVNNNIMVDKDTCFISQPEWEEEK